MFVGGPIPKVVENLGSAEEDSILLYRAEGRCSEHPASFLSLR